MFQGTYENVSGTFGNSQRNLGKKSRALWEKFQRTLEKVPENFLKSSRDLWHNFKEILGIKLLKIQSTFRKVSGNFEDFQEKFQGFLEKAPGNFKVSFRDFWKSFRKLGNFEDSFSELWEKLQGNQGTIPWTFGNFERTLGIVENSRKVLGNFWKRSRALEKFQGILGKILATFKNAPMNFGKSSKETRELFQETSENVSRTFEKSSNKLQEKI